MQKKRFYSQLFGKIIEPSDKEFWNKYYAEALYRLYDLEDKNCGCMQCQDERIKLEEFIKNKRDLISNLKIQKKF